METVMLMLTNLPNREAACKLAEALVGARLAACVNVMAECVSVYRWNGAVETAAEVPVLIKTRTELYSDVEAFIRAHHPYELPEVIALPVQSGLASYLAWVTAETRSDAQHVLEQT
jgi:periplasmic divalent cation tolerance protein